MQLTQLFWRFVGCQSTTGKTAGQTLDDTSITTAAQSQERNQTIATTYQQCGPVLHRHG
ncbi:MAG TPA: hypothetical protein PKK30_13140 [Nitrospira sp.]|nr:hypothetical protein [Nitrospira sp.]MCC7470909.1 hypothetical protein [Candidatus Nomurabacteria bacterium]HNO35259.1 hypothetical protein [Nitrospira sp.]